MDRRATRNIMGFYSRHLGGTLKKRLEDLAGIPYQEKMKLDEEIDIARSMALTALKLAQPALEMREGVTAELTALSLSCLGDALDRCQRLLEAQKRLSEKSGETLNVSTVNLVITQIVKELYEGLGEEHLDVAKKLEESLRTSITLPTDPQGTVSDLAVLPILRRNAKGVAAAMDALTSPSDPESALAVTSAFQGSRGGTPFRQDRDSEAEADTGVGGDEAVA